MADQPHDATLDEKIETVNANLKPLYKQRYDNSLLMEALDVMLDMLSDDDSDKATKEFQTKRKAEVEKELARTQQLIKFFVAKLAPLAEQKAERDAALEKAQAEAKEKAKPAPADNPVTEPPKNGHIKEGEPS